MRTVVVLPQPLDPSSATMLPGSMFRELRSTARLAEDFRDLGEAQRGRGNRDHDQAENTWLYFSISCGRIGFIKVQSGLKMPSRGWRMSSGAP